MTHSSRDVQTLFTKFQLTKEEELAAIQFTTHQRMYIQNIIAEAAEEKVWLSFDPGNPSAFMQREAELQGTIRTLTALLSAHDDYIAESTLASQAQSNLSE